MGINTDEKTVLNAITTIIQNKKENNIKPRIATCTEIHRATGMPRERIQSATAALVNQKQIAGGDTINDKYFITL